MINIIRKIMKQNPIANKKNKIMITRSDEQMGEDKYIDEMQTS